MSVVTEWFGERINRRVRDAAVARLTAAGEAGVATATSLVPVLTGKLLASIGYTVQVDTATLVLYADMDYALPVEMGHHTQSGSFVPPQPFIRPAALVAEDVLRTGRGGGTVATQYGGPGGGS